MDNDLLEACARFCESVQRFYPLIHVGGILTGFAFIGTALLSLRRRGEEHRPALPALGVLTAGVLLASVSSVVDALTMAVFQQSAPKDMASVTVGPAAGLENMVQLAVVIVMVVGAYQVVKGFVMLKEAAEGGHLFWPGITHVAGGILCLNIRAFMLVLGQTFGGTVHQVVQTLLAG